MIDRAIRMREHARRLTALERETRAAIEDMKAFAADDPHWDGLPALEAEARAACLALSDITATAQAAALEFCSGIAVRHHFPEKKAG